MTEENIEDEKEAYASENFYIKHAKKSGFFLTNKSGLKMPFFRKGAKLDDL